MSSIFLRAYQRFDLDEVRGSLLIVGEVTGNCVACGEMGLAPASVAICPNCNARFRYIASRRIESNPGERFQYAHRIEMERPDLIFIDLNDYQKMDSRAKARDILG